ncbi:uncharacterized protein LOC105661741 isoform X1 [Megachile rotundata]|uniref:uncharacterized protein LOC105661741 isoform X1 n=2 Tax=Megachile rotundata TaxID=143995 RepID=UPI003FD2F2A1
MISCQPPPSMISSTISRRITATMVTFTLRFVMELLENEYHLIGPHAASMNQITCSRGPKDCKFSSPTKTPKRRKKNNSGDMCMCIAPSKTGQVMSKRRRALTDGTVKQLERSRYSNLGTVRDNREEDEETETCTTLTDEEVGTGMYERGTQKIQHALQNRDGREDGGRRAMETGDARNDVVTDILEEIVEDDPGANTRNHQVPQNRLAKDKQRERELERWIERCRKECERQKNRRTNN